MILKEITEIKEIKMKSEINNTLDIKPDEEIFIEGCYEGGVPYFQINADGNIFWRKNKDDKELTKVKIDKDLVLAFMCIICNWSGMDYKKYIHKLVDLESEQHKNIDL